MSRAASTSVSALGNKRIIYDLLYRTSAEAMLELARDPKHLGAAPFDGVTSAGEREAAEAALNRIRAALAPTEKIERNIEMSFRLRDPWKRRAFLALCRRYGLRLYRYPRQRYSTILVRAPASFINRTLWPEYLEISRALDEYPREATERIIREEVFGDADEAEERSEIPTGLLAAGEPALGFAD